MDKLAISIHALLAESDIFPSGTAPLVRNFYPRSPCGERPTKPIADKLGQIISIHALLAESDEKGQVALKRQVISIHALLAESDRYHIY